MNNAQTWKKLLCAVLTACLCLANGGAHAQENQLDVVWEQRTVYAGDTLRLEAQVRHEGETVADLQAAGLQLWWWTDVWNEHADGLNDAVYSDYDMNSGNALGCSVTLPSEGRYYIVAELKQGDVTLQKKCVALDVQSSAVEGALDVERIPDLPQDYVMGVDISSLLSQLASGVVYRDFEGNLLSTPEEFCTFLRAQGITHVRIRVWNDPYDTQGRGYGGGNNDVAAAVRFAQACAESDLKMMVDFHYSDFWADPGKQQAPKSWQGYTVQEKADALYAFTRDALWQILETGVALDMVQIGNETTSMLAGESDQSDMCRLFRAGARAVREAAPGAKVVIHLTNPEKAGMLTGWAAVLKNQQVDYDVLATSYYPYWHGSLENLKDQLVQVQAISGKEVLVAESSYAFTLAETDWNGNTVRQGSNDTGADLHHPFSVQGQASFLRDLMAAVNEAGGLGVFYWEPAWITVGDTTGLEGDALQRQLESNQQIWEQYGSGWASSYAAEYDPDDTGVWYGGSAVDNQALFAADGSVLDSMHIWQYVRTGALSQAVSVDGIEESLVIMEEGQQLELPETVTVQYNKGAVQETVSWQETNIDMSSPGDYTVSGQVFFSKQVTSGAWEGTSSAQVQCRVTVKAKNLILDQQDAGFEKGGHFTLSGEGISPIPAWDDPKEGTCSMHWYLTHASSGDATYDVPVVLPAGIYTFEASAQGMAGDKVTLMILDKGENLLFTGEETVLAGWVNWQTPAVTFELTEETEIKLRVHVDFQAGGWGTVDCLYLHQAR